jgi:type IV pilus assembly protein PilC
MHSELPPLTKILLGTFKFIKTNFLLLIGGMIFVFFVLKTYFQTPVGILHKEQIIFRTPIIGDVAKLIIMERFASQMAILISSGVPIILALEIVQKLVENQTAAYLIARIREEVSGGKGLAVSMVKDSFFPILAVQMIQVGEETGELSKMFDHVAKYYKGNVETIMKRFGTIFEPVMLVFMAAMIGIIVVAIFLPLFKLGQGGGYQHS